MNKIPDRAKMRREYLLKKGTAYSLLACSGLAAFCSFGFALLVVGIAILFLSSGESRLFDGGSPLTEMDIIRGTIPFFFIGIIGGILCLVLSKATKKKLDALPYVPPAREQITVLPADEVLLRGSQMSAAASEELLRPAVSQETPNEQLLRASVGNHL